jgi:hypothetical protein
MRIALVSALAAVSLVAAPGGAATPAAAGGSPALRVGNTQFMSVVGSGFAPRSLVRVRVTGFGMDRSVSVRANLRGGFLARFPEVDRCSVRLATARTPRGLLARIPPSWFARECPPPPPLAPGPNAA